MNLKHESKRHAVIQDGDKWIATLNTEDKPGLAEAVLKVIEEYEANRAKRNDE